jgi:isopentenyldiphosphate isomerase
MTTSSFSSSEAALVEKRAPRKGTWPSQGTFTVFTVESF